MARRRAWSALKPGTLRTTRNAVETLKRQMGGRCERCGSREKLQFHHPYGRDWDPTKVNRWVRIARYRREANNGLLTLLCKPCNASPVTHPEGCQCRGCELMAAGEDQF